MKLKITILLLFILSTRYVLPGEVIPVAPPVPIVPTQLGKTWREEENKEYAQERTRNEAGVASREIERKEFVKSQQFLRSGIMVQPKEFIYTTQGENRLRPHRSQGLVILLDDAEYEKSVTDKKPYLGALTRMAWGALVDKVPLLISISLMKNIFTSPATDLIFNYNASQERQELVENDYVRKSFNPNEWVIRSAGESLLVLIPRKSADIVNSTQPLNPQEPKGLTKRERLLGLKIDHLNPLDDKTLLAMLNAPYNIPKNRDYFITALPMIFVTCAEYKHYNAEIEQPRWTFFFSGHGSLGRNVLSLQFEQLRKTLDFFETKSDECKNSILTNLLVVTSCSAMGTNAALTYKNMGEQIQKPYSFPIIMDAAYDTNTQGSTVTPILFGSTITGIQIDKDFKSFLTIIKSEAYKEPYDVVDIAKTVLPVLQPEFFSAYVAQNYPHIRPANKDYIISLFPGIEIGKSMAGRTQPLYVVELFKKQKPTWHWMYVVLHAYMQEGSPVATQYIKFPIIIAQHIDRLFIASAAPDAHTVVHRMKNLTAEFSLDNTLSIFIYPTYGMRRIFWLDTCIAAGVTYTNVVIDMWGHDVKILYTDANFKKWQLVFKNNEGIDIRKVVEIQEDYIAPYEKLFATRVVPVTKEQPNVAPQELLDEAINKGNVVLAQQALTMGADPNGVYSKDDKHYPLLVAIALSENKGAQHNNAEIAHLLINTVATKAEKTKSAEYEPVLAAITGPGPEASQAKAKAYMKQVSESKAAGTKAATAYVNRVYEGKTVLMIATQNAHIPLMRVLLNAGANSAEVLARVRPDAEKDPVKYAPVVTLLEQWEKKKKG